MDILTVSRSLGFAILFCAGLLIFNNRISAQEQQLEQVAVDEDLLQLQNRLRSPKNTVVTFLRAMENGESDLAARCLDLSTLAGDTIHAKKTSYSIKLWLALKKYFNEFDLVSLSENPEEAEQPYTISPSDNLADVTLIRNSNELWLFSRATVDLLDGNRFDHLIAEKNEEPASETEPFSIPLWIQQKFDESWWGTTFLLKDYQWICLAVLFLAGVIIGRVAKFVLDYLTKAWFRRIRTDVDEQPRRRLWTPIIVLIHVGLWYLGVHFIDLPSSAMSMVLPTLKFLMVVAAVWTALRLINLLQNYLAKRAKLTATRYDDSLVPLIGTALRIVAVALGIVWFVDVFDKDWKAVLGGFGLVGVAVAIAARDMLSNFFGSVTVLTDRPFEIGDWVVIDGTVEGTVEKIGIRSSRLRTFHGSEIVVPNSQLTTAIVDNMGRRKYRRFKTMLQVRYDTSIDQLEAFCVGIRKLIEDGPYTKNENAHVYVNNLGECSVDVLLYVFFECPDWQSELRERHCLIRDILRLAEELKVEFAFPTRTLEIDSSTDSEKLFVTGESTPAEFGRSAAERVNKQRE